MFKIFYIFIIAFTKVSLSANEPILATLNIANSNEVQTFSIGNSSFYCRPYGVITIDKLYSNSSFNSICKKGIQDYYLNNPQSKYFASSLFKYKQMYHIEFKGEKCIVYSNGTKSYSEYLIESGLGVRERLFNDREFKGAFKEAQLKAKRAKAGMWSVNLLYDCIVESYKE